MNAVTAPTSEFAERLTNELTRSVANRFGDNYDHMRYGAATSKRHRSGLRQSVRSFLANRGFVRDNELHSMLQKVLTRVAPLINRFTSLHKILEDDESRDLLVKLLAYRCLGHERVRLPLSGPEYWQRIAEVAALANKDDAVNPQFLNWKLYRLDMNALGYPMSLYATPKGAYTQFVLQQYRCTRTALPAIVVRAGDVVIDCGGCWGDTALYFSHLAGTNGRVFAFEFTPSNLAIMNRNLEVNPELASRVEIVRSAVWEESDLAVDYRDNGPGSTVRLCDPGQCTTDVKSISIDDLVERRALDRVDFIKMDIEGAELNALKGASSTLARFKPRLAIAVYHHLEDFVSIPELIHSISPDYKLYLRHFTIHSEETVLFAVAE